MRTLDAKTITEAVRDLCIRINHQMGSDMLAALERARAIEERVGSGHHDLRDRKRSLAAKLTRRSPR